MIYNIVLAFCAGVAVSAQGPINAALGKGLGGQPLAAALVSFAVGTLALLVVALFAVKWQPVAHNLLRQPPAAYTGGLLGALMVFAAAFLAPKLGAANMLFLVILGQLVMSVLMDHFGWFGMPVRALDWRKAAGLACMAAGVLLMLSAQSRTL